MVSREDSKEILISKTNDVRKFYKIIVWRNNYFRRALYFQLRNRLEGILESKFEKSDAFLLRWLVAGSYDVNRTEKALRESKAWKLNCWELQTLGVQDLEHLSSTFHLSANYIDKEGRTTLYLGVGKWPLKSYLSLSGGKEKFVKYVVQFVGRVSDLCQEKYSLTNGAVHQATIICDFGGFSLKQITSSSGMSSSLNIS